MQVSRLLAAYLAYTVTIGVASNRRQRDLLRKGRSRRMASQPCEARSALVKQQPSLLGRLLARLRLLRLTRIARRRWLHSQRFAHRVIAALQGFVSGWSIRHNL
jgi:hypothetical protein